eukprot:2719550-Amphidinium_carterae.1
MAWHKDLAAIVEALQMPSQGTAIRKNDEEKPITEIILMGNRRLSYHQTEKDYGSIVMILRVLWHRTK